MEHQQHWCLELNLQTGKSNLNRLTLSPNHSQTPACYYFNPVSELKQAASKNKFKAAKSFSNCYTAALWVQKSCQDDFVWSIFRLQHRCGLNKRNKKIKLLYYNFKSAIENVRKLILPTVTQTVQKTPRRSVHSGGQVKWDRHCVETLPGTSASSMHIRKERTHRFPVVVIH